MGSTHLAGLFCGPDVKVELGDELSELLGVSHARFVRFVSEEQIDRLDLPALGYVDAFGLAELDQGPEVQELEAHQRGGALGA